LRAPAVGATLKPMMTAFDAIARLMSISLMPPDRPHARSAP
jgi:hypothetical protein